MLFVLFQKGVYASKRVRMALYQQHVNEDVAHRQNHQCRQCQAHDADPKFVSGFVIV